MSLNAIGNTASVNYQNYNAMPKLYTQASYTNVANTYRADSLVLNNIPTKPIPEDPYIDPNPPEKPSFFHRAEVRLTGMMLGSTAVGGGIGYAIGNAFGRAGLGAAIGAGVGIATPIALFAYAIYSWNKNS